MYRTKDKINLENELFAIIQFTTAHWDGFDVIDSKHFFNVVWEVALEYSKNAFDNYPISSAFHQLFLDMVDNPEKNKDAEKISKILSLERQLRQLSEDAIKKLDFSDYCTSVIKKIKSIFPDYKKLKPTGWSAFKKGYEEFDGMEEYSKDIEPKEAEEFQGVDSSGASTYNYVVRISLPHVMYDDQCQGRTPIETLIGAVMGHCYYINNQNNGLDILQNIQKIMSKENPFAENNFNLANILKGTQLENLLNIPPDTSKKNKLKI